MQRFLGLLVVVLLACATSAPAAVIFGNNGLQNGSRWDAAPRNIGGNERSLSGGLRYSLQGGSYQAYRDLFNWSSVPSVADFQLAVEQSFDAWSETDPVTGLTTDLAFVADLATPVVGPGANGQVNTNGAEIDLLAETDGFLWNPGDPGLRAESFFNTTGFTSVTLTSGTPNYPGFAISGADIKMNSNPNAIWNLTRFQTILTHEIGHAIGLGDVDVASNFGRFIDDNYNGSSSATALATLTNPWAHLVNPANPAASPLALFGVPNANPGVDTPGVDILMETIVPSVFNGDPTPLQNDDFGGRQFLYPEFGANPPTVPTGPIVAYAFPSSWNGTGSAVDDLTDEQHDGATLGSPTLSQSIPPGAPNATQSIDTHNGGVLTNDTLLLNNFDVAAAGGFQFQLDLFWDGTTNGADIQKVIDYAGTEFLQLENTDIGAGTGELRFGFNDTADFGPTLTINANQWHHVIATFDTEGNTVDGNGDLAGIATLSIDGVTVAEAVFKSNLGDGLGRPIAFGTFSGGVLGIIEFNGLIYNPTVSLLGRLPGDFDGDGDVDLDDFNILAANFGRLAGANFNQGDADADGDVDLDDFNILAANFGATAPELSGSLPEPGTLAVLTGLVWTTLLRRHRRPTGR